MVQIEIHKGREYTGFRFCGIFPYLTVGAVFIFWHKGQIITEPDTSLPPEQEEEIRQFILRSPQMAEFKEMKRTELEKKDDDDLSDMVQELKDAEASIINSKGRIAQIEYIMEASEIHEIGHH